MFRDRGDHCANCYCEPAKTHCGVRRRIFLKVILAFGTLSFIILAIVMISHFARRGFSDLSTIETGLLISQFANFSASYLLVIFMETHMYLEFVWLLICGVYEYMCDGLRYIRDHVRLPSWQNIRVFFSARGAMVRTPPQQEISTSESESDGERPPLPPKSRKVTEAAGVMPFQKLTSDISQGASSSNAPADESEGSKSSLLHRPHSSTQSTPSLGSSGRRGKKMSKRELFRNLMSEVRNLNPINEEDLDQQEASGVEVPLSFLTQNPSSGGETEQETSFTTEPKQTEAAEQGRTFKIDDNPELAPSEGVAEQQAQARTFGARKKQKDHGQTSANIVQSSGKEQRSGTKALETQRSQNQPSTSSYVPFSQLRIQSQASENEEVQRKQSSEIRFSGSQGVSRVSEIESSQGQTSTNYVGLPELENLSREFGIRIEKQSSPEQQTLSYVPLSTLENQAQEQTSMSRLFGSQEQAQASDITTQESQSQASASYVGLPELEKQSREFGTRTREKQSSPEMKSRYVPLSTLKNKAHEQTSPRGSPDSQEQVRASSIEHQSSGSYIELPILKRQSRESNTTGREGIQGSPEQQPVSRYVPFLPSECQSQEQTSATGLLGFRAETQASNIHYSQRGQDQAAASYVGHPEFEKQLKELDIRTAKEQNSPEHQSVTRYVPISPGDQVSGMHSIQRMQTNRGQTSAAGALDLQKQSQSPDVQRRRSSRKQTPPYYIRPSDSERQLREKRSHQNSPTSNYVKFQISKAQLQTSAIGEIQHSSQEKALQARASQAEICVPYGESGTSDIVDKLRNLEQASVVGFPRATSHTRHFREGQELTSSENYAERMLAEKSERGAIPKRRGTLSIGPERPIRGSGSRTKSIGESAEITSRLSAHARVERESDGIRMQQHIQANWRGYAPYPALSRSGRTPSQESMVIAPLPRREETKDQIRQLLSTDPPCLQETDKYEMQKKETILSLNLATGGLVLSQERFEESETEANSGELSFMYDQPMDVLDLSHIEVPLPPPKDEESTKEHRKD